MSFKNSNKECFDLIHLELSVNPSFLPFKGTELNHYINKLDKFASFEKYYIENILAGFTAFYCNDYLNKKAFITLVLIHPKYRGKGISKELMNKTLASIENNQFLECLLEVKKDNKKAIRLYESIGFIIKSQTNTSLLMTKRIS